ncbi:MAG: flavohemoglobin expression-modulating QEGLA motif protein [Acidobacteriota bacterium]
MRSRARLRRLLRDCSQAIVRAQKPIRILSALHWPNSVQEVFFRHRARRLPHHDYPPLRFAPRGKLREFQDIRSKLDGHDPLQRILIDTCNSYLCCVRMLQHIGTADFYKYSRDLYGSSNDLFVDGRTTNLELAQHFDRMLAGFTGSDIGEHISSRYSAEQAAQLLERRLRRYFRDSRVKVQVSNKLTANAAAGSTTIKIKRGRMFSGRAIEQLEHHEGHVHVGTTMNGRHQPVLKFLGKGAPRTTKYQEGLAVFSEFMSQTMDLQRLRSLTDRIIAIEMAEQGADFIDLYHYFLDRGHGPEQAFDNARRVTRGGLVQGHAPFTKDICYLDGVIRVWNFIRVAIKMHRPEFVRFLFVGKLTLEDVPILVHKSQEDLVNPPQHVPPWIKDMHFMAASMSLSTFLNRIQLDAVERYYDRVFREALSGGERSPGGH